MTRWKAICAYDGSSFLGWQSQRGGNTVQDFIETRLAEIIGVPIRIHGSGRTDAGVHAKAQVFHFDADWRHGPDTLLRAFYSGLPAGIQVFRINRVTDQFHARFSASGKRYRYFFHEGYPRPWEAPYCCALGRRKLDTEAMAKAAGALLGSHDFSAFGALRADGSAENPVKNMRLLEVRQRGHRIAITFEASGFLYKMARLLAGTLMEIGLGKYPPAAAADFLQAKQRDTRIATAPARGLWLEKVFYSKPSA